MHITSDFESGNGKNFRELDRNHFAFETQGESSSYACYFCVRVSNPEPQPQACRLEVRLDPGIEFNDGDRRCFALGHAPLWVGSADGRWQKLTDYRREDLTYKLSVTVPPAQTVVVSDLAPLFFTPTLEALRRQFPETRLGDSVDGRPLSLFELGNRASPDRILVIAGLHGIEFPGVWAAVRICEYLGSDAPAARRLAARFAVDVVPYGNPDATCRGRPRTNAHGVDIYREANPSKRPVEPEVAAVWDWVRRHPPQLYINLHGWSACERGCEPFEGAVRPATDLYEPWNRGALVARCDAALTAGANPISRYETIGQFDRDHESQPDNLPNLLAQCYGTIGYCYEPNMRTGPDGCRAKGVAVLNALAAPLLELER